MNISMSYFCIFNSTVYSTQLEQFIQTLVPFTFLLLKVINQRISRILNHVKQSIGYCMSKSMNVINSNNFDLTQILDVLY